MSITASDVIDRARDLLIDPDGVRWTDAEMLRWLTDAERAVVSVIPNASQTITTKALVVGPRQTIPAGGIQLLRAYRNLSAVGVRGNIIHEVEWELFNRQYPEFPTDTVAADVVAYAFDPNDPTAFYVFPPNDGTGAVEINYSLYPPALTALTDTLTVRDIFETALLDYVLFRAQSKDSDYAGGENVAKGYLANFSAFLSAQAPTGG